MFAAYQQCYQLGLYQQRSTHVNPSMLNLERLILTINFHSEPHQYFLGYRCLSKYPSSIREEELGNCDTTL